MQCMNCDWRGFKKLYTDHRSVALDLNPCLCIDCYKEACEAAIVEMAMEIDNIREEADSNDVKLSKFAITACSIHQNFCNLQKEGEIRWTVK